MDKKRLVVVSNRLPIVLQKTEEGEWNISPGAGGLVTALGPVLRDRGGQWIGWMGTSERLPRKDKFVEKLLSKGAAETGYSLKPVELTKDEVEKFYKGFSNEIIWPLFHDFPSNCNFDPEYWKVYKTVNEKFARAIKRYTKANDYVWVQDYHLMLAAQELRNLNTKRQMGFFLHIPFPPLDLFIKLPWRFKILEALLQFDLLGFQTMRDRRNFTHCVRSLIQGTHVVGRGHVCKMVTPDRKLRIGAFPISIDYKEFNSMARSKEVADTAWIIHANHPNVKLMLGVDRLDYSKGVPHRIKAFANALERYPELRGRLTLVQILVPSRRSVSKYERLKFEIEQLVGEINGKFTQVGWTPIHYIFRSLDRRELVGYYRTSELALITPLKDGMNLVAKEYCASSIDDGVLILSESAGAAAQLQKGALLVNPYDIEGMADSIYQAYSMEPEERKERLETMQRSIRRNDIFHWVNSFLKAGFEKDLSHFPRMEMYVPSPDEEGEET